MPETNQLTKSTPRRWHGGCGEPRMDPDATDLEAEPATQTATVTKIFPDENYGYLLTADRRGVSSA